MQKVGSGAMLNVKLIIIIIVNCFPKSTFEVIPTNPYRSRICLVAWGGMLTSVFNSDSA